MWGHKIKKQLKKELAELGTVEEFNFNLGHFYWSCFFKMKGQWYNIFSGDLRSTVEHAFSLTIRTAKSDKDFTGGPNNWVRRNLPLTLPN